MDTEKTNVIPFGPRAEVRTLDDPEQMKKDLLKKKQELERKKANDSVILSHGLRKPALNKPAGK